MQIVSIHSCEHYTWGANCNGWHLLRGQDLSVIQERMPPHTSEIAPSHARSHQSFFVLSGTLTIVLGNAIHSLGPEDGLEVIPESVHRVVNDTDADVRFIVISSPPSHGDRISAT